MQRQRKQHKATENEKANVAFEFAFKCRQKPYDY